MNQPNKIAGYHAPSTHRIRTSTLGGCLSLHIEGRFDFNCHQEFRRAYENASGAFQEYVVDLAATEYIDSAALGMLLVLRERVGRATVRITNGRPAVRKILQIANFASLFAID